MGYFFRVHHERRLVYKKVWGTYGDEESRAAHIEWDVIKSEGEIGDYDELQDLTEVTDYGVSIEQIRALANRYDAEWRNDGHPPKRMAYVTPSALAFGTGRVYGSLIDASGINFKVFKNFDDAADWLELSADDMQSIIEKKPDAADPQRIA